MASVGQRVIADLREKIYNHIQSLSISFFTRNPTGILMSRITNDVTVIQGAVTDALTGLLRESFTIVGLVAVVFYHNWKLAIIGPGRFSHRHLPGHPIRPEAASRTAPGPRPPWGILSTILLETISGNRIVKAFNMEDYEKERFAKENRKLFGILLKSAPDQRHYSSANGNSRGAGDCFYRLLRRI